MNIGCMLEQLPALAHEDIDTKPREAKSEKASMLRPSLAPVPALAPALAFALAFALTSALK